VSVTDFGAVGDGSTDCVLAFETAFTQLFRNVNLNYRKVLVIPNGEYLFTSDLTIPSNAIIQGETQNGAVLNIGSNNIRLVTSTGLELADFASGNRPQNIKVSNLTIQRTTGQLSLSGIANSSFENITVLGEYILGGTVTSLA
jgi:polygalacturonase